VSTPIAGAALAEVAEGIARRVRDAALAERQLERFAFGDDTARAARSRLAALAGDDAALGRLARDLALRVLAAAVEGYVVLARLGAEPVSVDHLSDALGLPALAVTERVGALAQLGLAARDLEHDALAGTPAGRGVVALVDGLAAAIAARCRHHAAELA
jgi:hypothetical protein